MERVRGGTKLEFALVVVIFGILATALLNRLQAIEADAERTEVELTVRNIRVGVQLAIGERIMRGEEARIAEVAAASPVDFLGRLPRNFNDGSLPPQPGQWTWDASRRELGYLPRLPEAFGDATELRWRYVARVDPAGRTVGVALLARN